MQSKIQKWGNSHGIRIPNELLKDLNLTTNDIVDIRENKGSLIITKKQSISFKERIKNYKGKNITSDFSWDEAVGKEIW